MARDLIGEIKETNHRYSGVFCTPAAKKIRGEYREKYPVGKIAFQCMDGRVHMANATGTPLGIITSFRSLGGLFSLGWKSLDDDFNEELEYHRSLQHEVLVFVTYHFSRSNRSFGCAGFKCNIEKAMAASITFKRQIERVYGSMEAVYPVLIGYETDEDALIIHGTHGEPWDLSREIMIPSEERILKKLATRFDGQMPENVKREFIPLVQGNVAHIAQVRASCRQIREIQHNEWIVAPGRGLDWLFVPNMAVIIGMYSYKSDEAVKTAADIIAESMREGRISKEDGFVLLASAAYRDRGGMKGKIDERRACERAREEMQFSKEVFKKYHPRIMKYMHELTVVTDVNTRRFQEVK